MAELTEKQVAAWDDLSADLLDWMTRYPDQFPYARPDPGFVRALRERLAKRSKETQD